MFILNKKKFIKSLEKVFLDVILKERFSWDKKRMLFILVYRLLNNFSKKDEKIILKIAKKFLKKINDKKI